MATIEQDQDRQIEIENIRAVRELAIPIPRAGGVVVLKGPNGSGKTTAIEAVSAIAGANGSSSGGPRLVPNDEADRGEVRLDSVLLRVGKNQRRSGDVAELGVSVLSGKYTIADLIAPPFKDPQACEDHAIKTLAQLAGSGDVSLFYEMAGGQAEFEKLVPLEVAGSLDVVALAGKVERALQQRAREAEQLAIATESKADGLSTGARELGLDSTASEAEYNQTRLAEARDHAVAAEARLRQQAVDANEKLARAREAETALEDAKADLCTGGPSVEEAQAALATAEECERNARELFKEAEKLLDERQRALSERSREANQAARELERARANEAALEKFRGMVAAAKNVTPVSEDALREADEAAKAAKAAEERGVLVRKALEDRKQANGLRLDAKNHRSAAQSHRDCAGGVDEVLSGLVAKLGSCSKLFVKRGRLMTTTHRGEESFWELSDGERSEIAVSVFARAVGQHGLLPLPQSFWEGLDWEGRKRVAALCESLGVVAVTAECDRDEANAGPLRAEVFAG